MSFFDQVGGLLRQYSGGAGNQEEASEHLQQVANQASQPELAGMLSQVFQSPQTGTFGQNISQMFSQSNPEQRAGILNQLMGSVGPGLLGGLLGNLGGNLGAGHPITPEQASRVTPEQAEEVANHAQMQNPSIVDQAGQFYSQHPNLVKALGAGAAIFALRHLAEMQQRG